MSKPGQMFTQSNREFHKAVKDGDLKTVLARLDKGHNIEQVDGMNNTPLKNAIYSKRHRAAGRPPGLGAAPDSQLPAPRASSRFISDEGPAALWIYLSLMSCTTLRAASSGRLSSIAFYY